MKNCIFTHDKKLRESAQGLLDAAMDYWKEYNRAVARNAVVWLEDTDGRVVILTRGEYREELMENIDNLTREKEIRYFD